LLACSRHEYGFGLSYSTFSFHWGKTTTAANSHAIATGETALTYSVTVKNTGKLAAGVAVLGFVNASRGSVDPSPPLRELFNFTRVWLAAGQSKTLELSMGSDILANTDAKGVQAVRKGTYGVAIGGVGRAGRVEDGAVYAELEVGGEDAALFSMAELRERHERKQV